MWAQVFYKEAPDALLPPGAPVSKNTAVFVLLH